MGTIDGRVDFVTGSVSGLGVAHPIKCIDVDPEVAVIRVPRICAAPGLLVESVGIGAPHLTPEHQLECRDGPSWYWVAAPTCPAES